MTEALFAEEYSFGFKVNLSLLDITKWTEKTLVTLYARLLDSF